MLLGVGKFEHLRLRSILRAAGVALVGAAIAMAMPQSGAPANAGSSLGQQTQSDAQISQNALRIVVLDPAHGGTDLGARGTGGLHESDIVLDFAGETRRALEQQGFQVLPTRQGTYSPSFDFCSAI